MKNGVKTSEFWVTVSTVLCILLKDKLGLDLDPTAVASLAGAVGAYVLSRGQAKRGV